MGEALHNTLNQTPLFVRARTYAVALGLSAVTAAGCGGQETPSPDQSLGGGNTPAQEASPSVDRPESAPASPDSSPDSPSPSPSSSDTYVPAQVDVPNEAVGSSKEEQLKMLECMGIDPYSQTTQEEMARKLESTPPEVIARCNP